MHELSRLRLVTKIIKTTYNNSYSIDITRPQQQEPQKERWNRLTMFTNELSVLDVASLNRYKHASRKHFHAVE